MNTKIKIFLNTVLIAFAVVITSSAMFGAIPEAYGQGGAPANGLNAIKGAYPANTTQDLDVGGMAKKIIDWALYLAAIVAVLFIIYGGFIYITSAGDQTAAGKGKSTLINAIIGLVIVVFSYMIVQTVYRFLIQ